MDIFSLEHQVHPNVALEIPQEQLLLLQQEQQQEKCLNINEK